MTKHIIGILPFVLMIGCSGAGMEWKGTLKGTFEIQDHKLATDSSLYPTPAPLDSGSGSAMLESGLDNLLRLGKDTPIPGCMLSFNSGSPKRDSTGAASSFEYKINQDAPLKRDGPGGSPGCVGRIDNGTLLGEIEIDHAVVSIKKDGEFYIGIDYRKKGDYDKKRIMQITGTKGWF